MYDAYAVWNPLSSARARDRGVVPCGGMWVVRITDRDVHPVQLQTGSRSQGWATGLLRLGAGPGPERAVVDGGHHPGGGDRTALGAAVVLRPPEQRHPRHAFGGPVGCQR